MEFHQFFDDDDIHVLDFSGEINFKEGLSKIEQVEKILDSYIPKRNFIKLLIDFRNTKWESVQIHNILAKISREKFTLDQKNICKYTAILNNTFNGKTFENECWFTNRDEAYNWLLSQFGN